MILFSDECKFNLYMSDGKVSVRRIIGKRYDSKNIKVTVKHGGGKVMCWGCISSRGVGNLAFIDDKIGAINYKSILANNLKSSVKKMKLKHFYCIYDNDPKHKSKIVKDFLEKNRSKF